MGNIVFQRPASLESSFLPLRHPRNREGERRNEEGNGE